jgi:hypothetical protein
MAHMNFCTPAEVRLAETTLASIREAAAIERAGRGEADARDHRQSLRQQSVAGIELICPHKKNRVRTARQGRALRRYRKRWIVERTIGSATSGAW